MRKVLALIVLASCLLSLVGCKKQAAAPATPATTAPSTASTTVPAETEAPTQAEPDPDRPAAPSQLNLQAFAITVAYAQWSGDSQLYMGGLNADKMDSDAVKHLPIYKLDSLEALASFQETHNTILTEEPNRQDAVSFPAATAGYDLAFFRDNSLLAVYISASSGSYRFAVDSIQAENGGLCVCIAETAQPEVGDTAMAGWFAIISVPKPILAQYQSFDAVMI